METSWVSGASPDGALDMGKVYKHDVDECFLKDVRVVDDVLADVALKVLAGFVHQTLKFNKEVVILDACLNFALDIWVDCHVGGDDACTLGGFAMVGDFTHVTTNS